MQFQADILDVPWNETPRPTFRSRAPTWPAWPWHLPNLADVAALVPPGARFEPRMSASDREAALDGWRVALARTTAHI
jgi:glycerol kinase